VAMCVWKVAEQDRLCKYCSYRGGCERYESKPFYEIRGQYYIRIMNGIINDDILRKSRKKRLVWGRYIVAYQMRKEGYQLVEIAKCLGLMHCTIVHSVHCVEDMLKMPGMYQYEMGLWEYFQEILSLQKQ